VFLTDAQLIELTKRKRRPAQQRMLVAMGITHKVRPDGSVAVLSAHVEKMLDGKLAPAKLREEQPDWEAA
jgi:hypothetical protein